MSDNGTAAETPSMTAPRTGEPPSAGEIHAEQGGTGTPAASESAGMQSAEGGFPRRDGKPGKSGDPGGPGAQTERAARSWGKLGTVLVGLLCVLVLAGMIGGISLVQRGIQREKEAAEANRPREATNVTVTELKPATVVDAIDLPAEVLPWVVAHVPAEVDGQVRRIATANDGSSLEGRYVAAEDPLLVLDPRDFKIDVEDKQAVLRLARQNLERTKALRKLENAIATRAQLEEDLANLRRAEAALEAAELALARATIVAPVAGRVQDIRPEVGDYVSAGDPVAVVLEDRVLKVEVRIPSRNVDAVRSLKTCELVLPDLGDEATATGTVTYLSPMPEGAGQAYTLRLRVENKDGRIRPGMLADAHVVQAVREKAVVAPLRAILARGKEHFAYVVEDLRAEPKLGESKPVAEEAGADPKVPLLPPRPEHEVGVAKLRKVRLGIIMDRDVEILSGLAHGERLVVQGQKQIADGARVRLTATIDDPAELRR